jgi:membrane protease YdiL (CAAX protease family)
VWVASFVGRPRREQFGLRPPLLWRRAVLAVPLTYLGFIVISAIWSAALNTSASEKHLVKDVGGHSGTIGILAACLVTCVVAPICEEFLFRGFIFRALRNWRGPWPAAVLTGVLFGAIHVGSAPAVDLVPLGVLGIMLCAIREWSGSLYPCIALHALNNSIALGIDESWGWQIAALMLSSLALISLTLVLSARLSSVRLA